MHFSKTFQIMNLFLMKTSLRLLSVRWHENLDRHKVLENQQVLDHALPKKPVIFLKTIFLLFYGINCFRILRYTLQDVNFLQVISSFIFSQYAVPSLDPLELLSQYLKQAAPSTPVIIISVLRQNLLLQEKCIN